MNRDSHVTRILPVVVCCVYNIQRCAWLYIVVNQQQQQQYYVRKKGVGENTVEEFEMRHAVVQFSALAVIFTASNGATSNIQND